MPQFSSILKAYQEYRADRRPLVMATVVATRGSTYRKAGAVMLLDENGVVAGLLSGGCLESDLLLHAREVLATGVCRLLEYDLRPDHEIVWGTGTGCEGASTIFLQRLNEANEYGALAIIATARANDASVQLATILECDGKMGPRSGAFLWQSADDTKNARMGSGASSDLPADMQQSIHDELKTQTTDNAEVRRFQHAASEYTYFRQHISPPPALLILGAGPDALPVIQLAVEQGWRVHVADHRPLYIESTNFPAGVKAHLCRPSELPTRLDLTRMNAAVVMSHHFESDAEYLRTLLPSAIGYVGLLGPVRRRDRLLEHIGMPHATDRLRSPIGLDLGGDIPESIALSIIAEIQTYLSNRKGKSLYHKSASGPRESRAQTKTNRDPRGLRIVLLAAGGASRMGQAKQLLAFEGQSLLSRATALAISTGCAVDVVLGAALEQCRAELKDLPVRILENPDWQSGIASSIRAGVRFAPDDCQALLFMLVDQPRIPAQHFAALRDAWSTGAAPIIASAYGGVVGVPAIFSRTYFTDLLELQGDRGARALLRRETDKTLALECPEGLLDIDRPEDLKLHETIPTADN